MDRDCVINMPATVHLQRLGVDTCFVLLKETELVIYADRIVQLAGPIRVATTEWPVFLCEIGVDEEVAQKGRKPRPAKECPHNPGVSCGLWKTEPQRCAACSWNEDKAVEAPPEAE